MDIVIPYKPDQHDGIELKYALRSIEKYLTGFRNIWVVGCKKFNTKFLPCQDIDGRKEFSIANKIWTACKADDISDPFIRWDDDHFLLKPLDVSDIKYWTDGSLKDAYEIARGGYKQAIENTMKLGCEVNFDVHTPIIFHKERFFKNVISKAWKPGTEFCVKSLYCQGMEGEPFDDLKINMPGYKPFLENKIKDRLFFSTGPIGLQPEMMELLEELYPEKSKYEI